MKTLIKSIKYGKIVIFWIFIISIIIIFTSLQPPIIYSFIPNASREVNFDGNVTNTSSGLLYINNDTIDAGTRYIAESNIRIISMMVPEQVYSSQRFNIKLIFNNSPTQKYELMLGFLSRDLFGADMIIRNMWNSSIESSIDNTYSFVAPSLRECDIVGEHKWGEFFLHGTNTFILDIETDNGTLVSTTHFPIEINPDTTVIMISNGIAAGSLIFGIAATVIWIKRDKKINKEIESAPSASADEPISDNQRG